MYTKNVIKTESITWKRH